MALRRCRGTQEATVEARATMMTDDAMRDLFLSDIAAIRTADALKVWGRRWAEELQASPHRDELRKEYRERVKELEK